MANEWVQLSRGRKGAKQVVHERPLGRCHTAEVALPLPRETRALAVQRSREVQRLWEQERKPVAP